MKSVSVSNRIEQSNLFKRDAQIMKLLILINIFLYFVTCVTCIFYTIPFSFSDLYIYIVIILKYSYYHFKIIYRKFGTKAIQALNKFLLNFNHCKGF